MAVIYSPTSPLARCSACGVQRQFHFASDVPRSADRDHPFVAETIDDFEPGDLTPEQLVCAISAADREFSRLMHLGKDRSETGLFYGRIEACRTELKSRVRAVLGVDWDDLMGSVEG